MESGGKLVSVNPVVAIVSQRLRVLPRKGDGFNELVDRNQRVGMVTFL